MTTKENPPHKPVCVVLDTNVWRSDLLLKNPVGRSLTYTLQRQEGFLGLPEVVEMELPTQIVEAGLDAARKLEQQSRIMNTLMGSPFSLQIPTNAELEQQTQKQLTDLEQILVRVPFTLEHARTALEMVMTKVAPNEKNQQFKDSAIWQAVLELTSNYCVHLVTKDRAFLADPKQPEKGLAQNLQQDCIARGTEVEVYCELASCLKGITEDTPSVNQDKLRSLILPSIENELYSEATRCGVTVGEVVDLDIQVFRLPDADMLAVDYTITFQCEPDFSNPSENRTELRATVHGGCQFQPVPPSVSDNLIQQIAITWRTNGGRGSSRRAYGEDPPVPFRRAIEWN